MYGLLSEQLCRLPWGLSDAYWLIQKCSLNTLQRDFLQSLLKVFTHELSEPPYVVVISVTALAKVKIETKETGSIGCTLKHAPHLLSICHEHLH